MELDRESLVSESVDRVLDSLSDDNKDLLEWLTQSVMDDLEKGKRYNLENNLKTVAMTLKSDEHRAAVEEYGIDEEKEYSKENLARMKKALAGVMASFVKEVKEAAKAFVSAAGEEGLANEDFQGSASILSMSALRRTLRKCRLTRLRPYSRTARISASGSERRILRGMSRWRDG